jgi:hypothetical protein
MIAGLIPFLFPRCANIVPPTGGPRDTIPPEIIKSTPPNYSTNFTGPGIHIEFDELIQLRNINQQFIITPPQRQRPDFRVRGRDLFIELKSDLIANTTYTLNFGNAIVDLNEGNALSNFEFVFSTGDIIDSLNYSGIVLNAFDNEPVEGAVVMLYDQLQDSIPYLQIPLYATRTGKDGRFRLNNLRADTFLVFALKDENNNYLYDRPGEEAIAFLNDHISPEHPHHDHAHPDHPDHDHPHPDHPHPDHPDHDHPHPGHSHPDHIQPEDSAALHRHDHAHTNDSLNIAAPHGHHEDQTKPDYESAEARDTMDLRKSENGIGDSLQVSDNEPKTEFNFRSGDTLFLFTEKSGRQYIVRNERRQRGQLLFVFNQPLQKEWSVEPLNFDPPADWKMVEKNARPDSITFWITDPEIRSIDNMRFLVSYWATGPADSLEKISDTLNMNFTPPRTSRRPADEDAASILTADFSISQNGNQELHRDLTIKFPEPLSEKDLGKITLSTVDNNQAITRDFELIRDSVKIRNYHVKTEWLPGQSYRFNADPGAFSSIFGTSSDSIGFSFTTREADHYATILLNLTGVDEHMIVQLLDERGHVLREYYISEDSELVIDFLQPQKFRLKAIFDANQNNQWDTGNYLKGIQPERVIFHSDIIATRSNWDIKVDWDLQ